MANNSDHKKPAFDVNQLLPEVFKSDVNTSLFGTSFNRHLTKDDTSRVAGYIGESNADAIVDRRIKESSPHRQAFQLAPTMISSVGTEDQTLSFKAFTQQLSLMGVDTNRIPKWGDTLQFNWVPPINIDMLINYQDYFWKPDLPTDQPQYLTIENRCNKARSKVASYEQMMLLQGSSFNVTRVQHTTSSLVIAQKHDDLFVPGFVFFTKNSSNINMQNKFWEVESAAYDAEGSETTIVVHELSTGNPISQNLSADPGAGSFVGEWYFNTTSNQLKEWTGSSWSVISTAIVLTISLEEQLEVFKKQANCVCNQDYGWDQSLWDDNTWSPTFIADISSATAPVLPSTSDLWYDTVNDVLKQYDGFTWQVVVVDFSAIIAEAEGTSNWDLNTLCPAPQQRNQWSEQNQWVHKSEVQSSAGARRAQLPIIEYGSNTELNEWVRANYTWKYRSEVDQAFVVSQYMPVRIELEPIKGYYAAYIGGVWTLYLYHTESGMCRDADYTATFVPGYRFNITDDTNVFQTYTVTSAEYREITTTDDIAVQNAVGTDILCTIITIQEPIFTSITVATGNPLTDPARTRIEPTQTSLGDTWRGYHAHWVLDENATTFSPVEHQQWNFYRQRSYDNLTTLAPGSIPEFPVTFSAGVYGIAHQEYTVGASGVSIIELHPTLRYNVTTPRMFATPDSNEVRVYVNDVRQYGNYTEIPSVIPGTPRFTVIGQTSISNTENPNITIPYVTGIQFNTPLNIFDVVRIEVGPAPFDCMGSNAIPVRTIEDEAEFTLATVAGTQPAYRSMTRCYHLEQAKTQLNQYPLFNVYDVATSRVVDANPIFSFEEDSTYSVNSNIQRRIVVTSDGKEYLFKQHLIDRDDNIIYAYRSVRPTAAYWYSPLTQTTQHWNGYAWSNRVIVSVTTGDAVRSIITSPTEPTVVFEKSLWFDVTEQKLFQSISGNWVEITDVTINGSDPLLRTIWRHGLNNERYVPQYVNDVLEPVTIGSVDGDWEVVDQWMYNPEHANKKQISYSQLVTHLRSIISSQPKIPGLQGGGVYTLTQEEFNYGLGGTIKEHNDSFDTLISAVNVTNVTPIGVIDFAAREYASCLLRSRDIFNNNIVELISKYDHETIATPYQVISNRVIAQYETNDFASSIYGDTTAYNPNSDVGIKNWIATIPMFGLGPKYRPHVSVDGDVIRLFHHDGHRSTVSYTVAEIDRISRQLCNLPDNRLTGNKLGVISSSTPPATETSFTAVFGGTDVRSGVFWYHTLLPRQLYKFMAYDVTNVDPSVYDTSGNEIPDGTMYFNKSFNVVRVKVGLVWQDLGTPPGDVSALWVPVNLPLLLAQILLAIEEQLYNVTEVRQPAFDYDQLTVDLDEETVFNNSMKQRFDVFVSSNDITAPLVNLGYTATDAFSWNYSGSIFSVNTFPRLIQAVETPVNADYDVSSWQELYTRVYGTPYPHLEPWKLQGYYDKPTWWDDEYVDTTGVRRWKYTHSTTTGMWENIRTGVIPAGRPYPDGDISTGNTTLDGKITVIPTFRYFSVNISDAPVGGYGVDEVFPPYFNTVDLTVRSLFTQQTQIPSPSADYAFGDVGPTEWQWLTSAQHPYDLPVVAFVMQPAKFLHSAFGTIFTHVDALQVDTLFKQVYSHEDALFHGDVYLNNIVYKANGLNQWYINFNRYTGFDSNLEFRELWARWEPHMTYQFGGIVDTSSFEISNKYFDVSDQDYNIILANSGVLKDLWVDAFEVSILTIPPAVVQYNNQNLWKFELDSLAATPRSIPYYGVHHYPMTVDVTANTLLINTSYIVAVSAPNKRFYVGGNHTATLYSGKTIGVQNAGANTGSYTVTSAVYDSSTNRTRITVQETIPSNTVAGIVDLGGVIVPWNTGDAVVVSSSKFTPPPLKPNTTYYVIKVANNVYQLAETQQEAVANLSIDLVSVGDGVTYVSQVDSSFEVFGGVGNTTELWFHYAIDRNTVHTFTPPTTVTGMQSLVNIIDGYAAYQLDNDIVNNGTSANDFDPTTGRLVDWHVETERFIDWAFGLRQARVRVSDRYGASVNTTTDEFVFTDMVPVWLSGTAVTVQSTGTLPQPLIPGATYYVVSTATNGTIKLSTSSNAADVASHVDILSSGSGTVSIGVVDSMRAFPRFELNPYRNNVWVETPQGILSNVIEGPYTDIRVNQTIFDQYSRPLAADKLVALREDKISRIAIRPNVPNDVDKIYKDDPYNYLHIGGAHLFVEGYEHYLVFEHYTAGGALIYDAFLGLWAKRYNLDYFEKTDYTLRPTLGGYYLIDQHFERNLEGSAEDMRLFYDVLGLPESTDVARRARGLLGYKGTSSFLDLLNVNKKTQFMFYRGMIQSKGSINSVKAYINSRRFVDAKLDEFWAWKVAEFGDVGVRVYPEVKLFSSDAGSDDVRWEFLDTSESETDPDVSDSISKGFVAIHSTDTTRWNIHPEQMSVIKSPLFLDAAVSSLTSIYAGTSAPTFVSPTVDFWFNTTIGLTFGELRSKDSNGNWSVVEGSVTYTNNTDINGTPTDVLYVQHTTLCDDVRVIRKIFDAPPIGTDYTTEDYTTEIFAAGTTANTYFKVNSRLVRLNMADIVTPYGCVLQIFTLNPAKKKISPAKLIDTGSNTVLQQLPLWHPALGYHSPTAIHNVDIQAQKDPARYNVTLASSVAAANNWDENFWNQQEVGKVWMDTSTLGYVPYYDDKVYPSVNDRLYNWGKQSPWSSTKVYEWVESTTPPSDWSGSGTPLQNTFVRTRAAAVLVSAVSEVTDEITVATPFAEGDRVIVVVDETGTMPEGIEPSYKYVVTDVTSGGLVFKLYDPLEEVYVDITTVGAGTISIIKEFDAADWSEHAFVHDAITLPMLLQNNSVTSFTTPHATSTITWVPENMGMWQNNGVLLSDTTADVYVNGVAVHQSVGVQQIGLTLQIDISPLTITLNEYDIIEVVRPVHTLTSEEESFDPDTSDDGTALIQWKRDYQYSTNTHLINSDDANSTKTSAYYYFWVQNSLQRADGDVTALPTQSITTQIEAIPTPYMVVQRPKDDPYLLNRYGYGISSYSSAYSLGILPEETYQVPVLYREAIIRGVIPYISNNDKCVVRFTRDWTLRNTLRNPPSQQMLKNKHEEWVLFRKSQQSTIPRQLWDRLTEAMMGYTLADDGVRVPALERELYDATYETDTQYGLGIDQAFVQKDLGLATVLAYLRDSNNDFKPQDIDAFFATYSFDTPENIRIAMDVIYTSFNAQHVNAIWFDVLNDSLSLRAKYKELMKTSWIALHGIRVLEVGGIFDD